MEKINELLDTIISQFKDNRNSIIGIAIYTQAVNCKIEMIDKEISNLKRQLEANKHDGMMLRLLEDEIKENGNNLNKLNNLL